MKYFGLIGYPLKNSLSVNYFNEKFKSLNLDDYVYENLPIKHIEDILLMIDHNKDLYGLNITIPYKVSIINYLDEIDESAKVVGAVNCVKIIRSHQSTDASRQLTEKKNYKLIGFNTDVYGFEKSLLSFLNNEKKVDRALILGTGGASKAVAYVLKKLAIEFTFVTSNRKSQIDAHRYLTYEMLNQHILNENHLIINCTPVGMFPNENESPNIPYQYISPDHFAFDLIYLPPETLFLKRIREQGALTKNGLEMLHLQADKAWEIFQ